MKICTGSFEQVWWNRRGLSLTLQCHITMINPQGDEKFIRNSHQLHKTNFFEYKLFSL